MWLTGNLPIRIPWQTFIFHIFFIKKEMIKIFCVYKITNLINHKLYIGITKRNPKIRFNEHFSNKNELLYKAKEKYGKENFSLEIIEKDIPEDNIDEKERYYIKLYNSLVPNGYNLSIGGISNKSISDEGKQKLKECNLDINNPKCNKYILMISKDTNEILNRFGSAREAARFLGNENKYRSIAYCLSGKSKSSQGYFWRYEE